MRFAIFAPALLMALTLTACGVSHAPLPPSLAMVDSLPKAGGSTSASVELSRPVVMLHFFASWCTQCFFEFPHLVAMRRSIGPEKLGMVAIAVDDSAEAVAKLVSSFDLPFAVVLDSSDETKSAFAVRELPMTVFVSRDGRPVMLQDAKLGKATNRFEGAYEWDRGAALSAIEQALQRGEE